MQKYRLLIRLLRRKMEELIVLILLLVAAGGGKLIYDWRQNNRRDGDDDENSKKRLLNDKDNQQNYQLEPYVEQSQEQQIISTQIKLDVTQLVVGLVLNQGLKRIENKVVDLKGNFDLWILLMIISFSLTNEYSL